MPESAGPPCEAATWVVDTGVFVACGRQENAKYTTLERFTRKHSGAFVTPQRVYEELGGAANQSTPGQTPIDSAISAEWVTDADEIEYTDSTVSAVMDDVRRYIASASNRSEDRIEKTDTALAAVAAQRLSSGDASFVYIVTTDTAAGEGTVSVLETYGFDDQIAFIDGFEVNYPCLLAAFGGSLRQGLPASTTRFADTTAVSAGSAVSTGVPSE